MSERWGLWTTKFKDEHGKIYDLGKFEYLPPDTMAVNAWVEKRDE